MFSIPQFVRAIHIPLVNFKFRKMRLHRKIERLELILGYNRADNFPRIYFATEQSTLNGFFINITCGNFPLWIFLFSAMIFFNSMKTNRPSQNARTRWHFNTIKLWSPWINFIVDYDNKRTVHTPFYNYYTCMLLNCPNIQWIEAFFPLQ